MQLITCKYVVWIEFITEIFYSNIFDQSKKKSNACKIRTIITTQRSIDEFGFFQIHYSYAETIIIRLYSYVWLRRNVDGLRAFQKRLDPLKINRDVAILTVTMHHARNTYV